MQLDTSTGVEHLAFDTMPWGTVEEGALARLLFDQWRKTRCLKTMADWADWQGFYAFKSANGRRARAVEDLRMAEGEGGYPSSGTVKRGATGRIYKTATGLVGVVLRTFLAALVQRAWGISGKQLSQRKLAEWLTAEGYPTKLGALKNARSALLNEQVVPATEEVIRLLNLLKDRFSELEIDRFLLKN
jgi:hypothetical protein